MQGADVVPIRPRVPIAGVTPDADVAPAAMSGNLLERWNADTVTFARDIGMDLSKREQALLRGAMGGNYPKQRRDRRELERLRQKMETRLRKFAQEQQK